MNPERLAFGVARHALISLLLTGVGMFAQQPVVTTNIVTAAPSFRIVNGQLYNTDLSTNFATLEGRCIAVQTNGVIVQQFQVKQTTVYPTNAAELAVALANRPVQLIKEEVVPGSRFFIRNFPDKPLPVVGSLITARAMRDGVYTYKTEVIELWDYGTPNRTVVVTTNSISTNALKSGKIGS